MSAKAVAVPSQISPARTSPLAASSQMATTFAMLLVDCLSISAVFLLSVFAHHWLLPPHHSGGTYDFLVVLVALLACFTFQGLYPGVLLHPADEMRRLFLAITSVLLLLSCSSFFWRNAESYSRSIFLLIWLLGSPCIMFARRLSRRYLSRCPWWGVPAIVLGANSVTLSRVLHSLSDGRRGIKVVGIYSDYAASIGALHPGVPILGPISAAADMARTKSASIAIVTSPLSADGDRHAVRDCCRGFAHIVVIPELPGLCSLGVTVREIGGELGLEMPQRLFHLPSAFAKRTLDIVLSGLALLLLLPVFLILAVAIRLSSKGPTFFGQQRYGRHGKAFRAWKFRTMVPDAEKVLQQHLSSDPALLSEWTRNQKLQNDPRIISAGTWIRRLSLDELPQLWNVFCGDMSLIGPRPIVKGEIERYGRTYDLYSRVRPGMTGLWQVSGRNRTTYAQRVALDEFYVNNWSVWLDLYILSRTFQVVLTADGAY